MQTPPVNVQRNLTNDGWVVFCGDEMKLVSDRNFIPGLLGTSTLEDRIRGAALWVTNAYEESRIRSLGIIEQEKRLEQIANDYVKHGD